MQGKTVGESSIVMAQVMMPGQTNPYGVVHGGEVVKLIDTAAAACAVRHARQNVVTASIDRLDFLFPVFVGDMLHLKASINYVGRTSMEVGVRVEAENLRSGMIKRTASAYLTFVALDENHNPVPITPLILETEDERRRHREAQARRETRLKEKERESAG